MKLPVLAMTALMAIAPVGLSASTVHDLVKENTISSSAFASENPFSKREKPAKKDDAEKKTVENSQKTKESDKKPIDKRERTIETREKSNRPYAENKKRCKHGEDCEDCQTFARVGWTDDYMQVANFDLPAYDINFNHSYAPVSQNYTIANSEGALDATDLSKARTGSDLNQTATNNSNTLGSDMRGNVNTRGSRRSRNFTDTGLNNNANMGTSNMQGTYNNSMYNNSMYNNSMYNNSMYNNSMYNNSRYNNSLNSTSMSNRTMGNTSLMGASTMDFNSLQMSNQDRMSYMIDRAVERFRGELNDICTMFSSSENTNSSTIMLQDNQGISGMGLTGNEINKSATNTTTNNTSGASDTNLNLANQSTTDSSVNDRNSVRGRARRNRSSNTTTDATRGTGVSSSTGDTTGYSGSYAQQNSRGDANSLPVVPSGSRVDSATR